MRSGRSIIPADASTGPLKIASRFYGMLQAPLPKVALLICRLLTLRHEVCGNPIAVEPAVPRFANGRDDPGPTKLGWR